MITYTNRKGKTLYLCLTTNKSGNQRYVFAAEPKGQPVDVIPDGYEIRENVNGLVSLGKISEQIILPKELAYVTKAINRLSNSENYRVDIKKNEIVIYENNITDSETIADLFSTFGIGSKEDVKRLLFKQATFSPLLKFALVNKKERLFQPKRLDYRAAGQKWIDLYPLGTISALVKNFIPSSGINEFHDEFFDTDESD